MRRPFVAENLIHSTKNTPMNGLVEFIETTTVTKHWIYRRSSVKLKPKAERNGKVIHITPKQ